MTDSEQPDSSPVASPAPAPKQTATSGPLPAAKSKKGKPPTPPQIRVVNILVLGFLAYAVVNYMGKEGGVTPSSQTPVAAPEIEPSIRIHSDDPRIDRLLTQDAYNAIGRVFPRLRAGVGATTLVQGDGRAVFCGQTVTYRLREGVNGTGAAGPEKTIALGNMHGHESSALTWGLEGARIGEIRALEIPDNFNATPFSNVKIAVTKQVVEVLAAKPELPRMGELALRRFIQRGGAGYDLRCGDQAIAHMTIWDSAGQLLFSSLGGAPVYFEMGVGKGVPYGIELAAREMGPGGAYTVIIPAELVKPLHPDEIQATVPKELEVQPFPATLKLPEKGVLIVDLDFVKEMPLKPEFKPAAQEPKP